MNRKLPLAVLMAALAIAAGCDRTKSSTAYNNSGKDATAAEPASTASPGASTTVTTTSVAQNESNSAPAAQTSSATPDTASPNVASSTAAPADNTGNGAPSTGAVSETVTTGKIKAAIAADSAMKDSDISVTTNNGVVTLSGTVKSQDQVAIATNLAQRQEGVQRVESNVTVR